MIKRLGDNFAYEKHWLRCIIIFIQYYNKQIFESRFRVIKSAVNAIPNMTKRPPVQLFGAGQ